MDTKSDMEAHRSVKLQALGGIGILHLDNRMYDEETDGKPAVLYKMLAFIHPFHNIDDHFMD